MQMYIPRSVTPKQHRSKWQLIFMIAVFLSSGCQTSCGGDASSSAPKSQELTTAQKKKKAALIAQPPPDTDSAVASAKDTAPTVPDPITLATLPESAFGKTLAVDETTVYLLTSTAMWRFSPNREPTETKLDLRFGPAFTDTELIFWSAGKMQSVAKTGGTPKLLGEVRHRPRKIVASGNRFAWLDLSDGGSFTFQTLNKGKSRVLYRTTNKITSPIMLDHRIYFVERATGSNEKNDGIRWRIGGVSVKSDDPAPHIFGPWQSGRTPSMLGGETNVFYFDMPGRSVRRLNADLTRNVAIAHKVVCTPFAVSNRVLCARVEGIFELPKAGGTPRILTVKPMGLTVNIAASDQLVAWLNDTGENQLTLRVLPLSPMSGEKISKTTSK